MTDRQIPNHIGYILDGNRRWAKSHGLPAYEGHLAGYNTVLDITRETIDRGVKFVSAFAFSTENWKRSEEEVSKLMSLVLKLLTSDIPILMKDDIRLVVLGTRENLDKKIIQAIEKAEAQTADNSRGTLALCFNYGGHLEIADAVKKIVQSGASEDEITPELIEQNLYHPEIPPCDIIVRTSGEMRISNFMLWRSAYSELLFLGKNWPDMRASDVDEVIEEFNNRQRRFGG